MDTDETRNSSETVGAQVRAARALQGVSLRHLAESIGVSPATLSQIERGRTSLSVTRLSEIAHKLGLGVSDILDMEPPRRRIEQRSARDWRVYQSLELDPILQAALDDFVAFGYHGSSIRNVAKRARLSVSGIYHHYESKQAMLLSIMVGTMAELLERAEAARDSGRDSVERFAALIENLALFHTYRIKLMVVGGAEQRSLEPDNRRIVAQMRVRAQRMIDEQVQQAVREGRFFPVEARERTRAIVTMLTALPTWWRPTGPLTPEQIADVYVRLALDLMSKPR